MIRCLVADDEIVAHQILEQYIQQVEGLTLVAKCRNAMEALAKLETHQIDLVFLDIEMPLVNGINFLKTLPNPPKVIITSAYSEYALEGYELNVVDYLLKPFSPERFNKAIEKVKSLMFSTPAISADTGFLAVKEKEGLIKIAHKDILYIEGSRDYMRVVTPQRQYLVHITMKKLEEMLPLDRFVRTHKSYIVSLDKIKAVRPDELQLGEQLVIPLSVNYREQVMKAFSKT
ncbi:MAG TPA: LytTR family DNA-binding domain-containing protein [Chitinophagaceae bacterium]|nr:LytTR family DNA-binding domain-containing protein [Chitinophagaceae bacterium]